ncbi:MAG: hypothetical protein RQ966_18805 [Acetobacteraceae bacterium]|nr:hypothetical protein [Acetobacteraceae bacterium]
MITKLLGGAVAAFTTQQHPGHLLEGDAALDWLQGGGLRYATISVKTGAATGFGPQGIAAVSELTRAIRRASPRYQRGIGHAALAEAIARLVIAQSGTVPATSISDEAAAAFEAALATWFDKEAVPRRHFIPCSLLPDRAAPLAVGPVTFVHAADFRAHPLGVAAADHVLAELGLGNLQRAMAERAAAWLAIVEIDGCHPSRSLELADLSVDVAIAALQLVIPKNFSEGMARITGRTLPPWRGDLSLVAGQLKPGSTNLQPGRTLSGAAFSAMLAGAAPLIAAAGHCLTAFVTGQGALPKLQQAWCDAAYWFHEGLVEPLDTVAAAKLETTVEVLLRAESTKGSSDRMRQAIQAVAGLTRKEPIAPGSAVTVDRFVTWLVGARSQVLHGTLSTLMAELGPERGSLTAFAHTLLVAFALQLAGYASAMAPTDEIGALLAWIEAQQSPALPPGPCASG